MSVIAVPTWRMILVAPPEGGLISMAIGAGDAAGTRTLATLLTIEDARILRDSLTLALKVAETDVAAREARTRAKVIADAIRSGRIASLPFAAIDPGCIKTEGALAEIRAKELSGARPV